MNTSRTHPNLPDRPEEACGVFGIYAPDNDVARLTYFGLHALQHRGQESAGIAVADGESTIVFKDMGLVPQVFDERKLASLSGHIAVGHVRYSTTGANRWENAQPVHKTYPGGTLAVAHNGNLINTRALRDKVIARSKHEKATTDTEIIAALVAALADGEIEPAVESVMAQLKGAYSLVIMTEDKLIAARDQYGIRPLCLGNLRGNYVVASETCALDIIGAEVVREVRPGEMLVMSEKGLESRQALEPAKPSLCVFEYIYFARPDSYLLDCNVYAARKQMGVELAREAPAEADFVVGVPDSGTPAAIGYAEESGTPFTEALIKNRYVGRTFIQPDQSLRRLGVKMKLNPLRDIIRDKRLVVIDDSIVRGNTSQQIVSLLRNAGAKEVHMRVSSPPVAHPCYYGIDTDSREQLIAARKNIGEIAEFLGVNSLAYLSIDGLLRAVKHHAGEFCMACFTGSYPIEADEDAALGKMVLEEHARVGG